MASRLSSMVALFAVVVTMFMACASAQSECTSSIVSLSPCLSYITGNTSTPTSSCCSQLASVVKSEPKCLCMVLNGDASQYGITINKTQALGLPDACNVETPPVSKCNEVAATPSASPTSTPGSSATPSTEGSGSKATPAGTSAGSTVKMTFSLGFS